MGIIRNKPMAELEVCGKKHTVAGNEGVAKIICLDIDQEQSCNYCIGGESIEFRVTICNKSDVNLFGVEFKDCLNGSGRYDKDSFRLNGQKVNADVNGKTVCININEIKAHQEVVITFEVCCDGCEGGGCHGSKGCGHENNGCHGSGNNSGCGGGRACV